MDLSTEGNLTLVQKMFVLVFFFLMSLQFQIYYLNYVCKWPKFMEIQTEQSNHT